MQGANKRDGVKLPHVSKHIIMNINNFKSITCTTCSRFISVLIVFPLKRINCSEYYVMFPSL